MHDLWRNARKACGTCHECGGSVQFTDNICPTCGVSHPVRIPRPVVLCGIVLILALTTIASVGF